MVSPEFVGGRADSFMDESLSSFAGTMGEEEGKFSEHDLPSLLCYHIPSRRGFRIGSKHNKTTNTLTGRRSEIWDRGWPVKVSMVKKRTHRGRWKDVADYESGAISQFTE